MFCGSGGEWKVELEQRLQKDAEIVLLAARTLNRFC
jgi:hypothetical protein